jgi:hypothetical protein
MKVDGNIIEKLKNECGDEVLETKTWPYAWPTTIQKPKAILLGCDPSNQHSDKLPYAFAWEYDNNIFNSFRKYWKENLEEIGLKPAEVYWQNLCKNYFRSETSKNKKWKKAAEIWIPYLREELDAQFDRSVPVLLSADILYAVLRTTWRRHKPAEMYADHSLVPIPPSENKLGRPLYPFYRGGPGRKYHLMKHPEYRGYLKTQIQKD